MSFHILPESGRPVVAGTVQRVTHLEQQTNVVKERMKEYSDKISLKFNEGRLNCDPPNLDGWQDLLETDPEFAEEFNRVLITLMYLKLMQSLILMCMTIL